MISRFISVVIPQIDSCGFFPRPPCAPIKEPCVYVNHQQNQKGMGEINHTVGLIPIPIIRFFVPRPNHDHCIVAAAMHVEHVRFT
jgi:hypothetical protein